jgi:hypothetical protein
MNIFIIGGPHTISQSAIISLFIESKQQSMKSILFLLSLNFISNSQQIVHVYLSE